MYVSGISLIHFFRSKHDDIHILKAQLFCLIHENKVAFLRISVYTVYKFGRFVVN